MIDHDPYLDRPEHTRWHTRGNWPCAWIGCPDPCDPPFVAAYRRRFVLDQAAMLRIHVTADERYELFLDGTYIGRGSERGDPRNWFFESYDLPIQPGPHVLVAKVWALGRQAPLAQMSVYPGFLLAPQDQTFFPLIGTGVAEWEVKLLEGYRFVDVTPGGAYFAVGANIIIDGHLFPWGFEQGEGAGWVPARRLDPGFNRVLQFQYPPSHLLTPATLPPMLDQPCPPGRVRIITNPPNDNLASIPLQRANHLAMEEQAWIALLHDQQPLTLPAHTRRRVVIDLENYYCAYPECIVSGGAGSSLRLNWAESLYNEPEHTTKGDRNAVDDKYFVGFGDTFLSDGGPQRAFRSLWWGSGRYIELIITTGAEALTLEHMRLHETRYPLEIQSTFGASDKRLEQIMPLMVRALQMCAHETYMDCPYYEQLMYSGDGRLEALTTYVITRDIRLPRKALRMFDESRLPNGLTQSRYPGRGTQIIAPFALWWVAMVYDYALWRDDLAFVRNLMPGVRAILDRFHSYLNADGLVEALPGWNFTDWVPEWVRGEPPESVLGVSSIINWQYALVLVLVARLERWLGEPALAARAYEHAEALAARLMQHFWNEERGLFADDHSHQQFSEHAQCLAILSGLLDTTQQQRVADGLLHDGDLVQTTIYFSHYLFETYALLGRIDALFERLQLWLELPTHGLKTIIEKPEPSRSDCHAWGAHPLYHYFASIIGIQPRAPGFRQVEVRPQLGPLTEVTGTLVHPHGQITVDLRMEHGGLNGHIILPAGVAGSLIIGNQTTPLSAGQNTIATSAPLSAS